jgi:acetyltransferase-like isoleucine patch superfamily enzyme/glycosyltransferase involved in cell wall biosynthesis
MSSLRGIIWAAVGKPLFLCTPHNAYLYRRMILKLFGMKCGRNVRIRRSVQIDKPWNLTIGDLVIFGDGVIVHAEEPVSIGKRSSISQYVMLLTTCGDYKTSGKTIRSGKITIEADCWIATDSVVMPSSHIEQGVVIGARGLVDGRLPKWQICVGEPAVPRAERVLYVQEKVAPEKKALSNIEFIIPVKNEEENLPYALAGVIEWADKVWVVDSESTDNTCEIARKAGAHVVVQPWLGYAKQKNWAIDNLDIQSDWVFILDADEMILPHLKEELLAIASRPIEETKESAFNVNRYFVFLEKRIRHCGYYPSWNVRFFKRGKARYENREVHEHMIVDGKIGKLRGHMEHNDRRGLSRYLSKYNQYSTLEAKEIILQPEKDEFTIEAKLFGDVQQRRRWVKRYVYPWLPAKWLFRFIWMYGIKLGFLDGITGFRFCLFISTYEIFISMKMIELRQRRTKHDN